MASSDIVVPSTSSPRDSDEVSSPSSSSTSLSAKEKKPDGETTAKETENEIVEEEKDVKSKPRKTVSFLHLDDDTSDKMKSSGVPPTLEENVDEEKTFDMSMDNTSLIMAAHASIDPSTPPELKAAAKVDAAVVALAVAENVKAAVENADDEPVEDRKDEDTSAQEADALGEAASDEIEKKPKKPKVVETSPSGRYVRFNDLLGEGAFKKVYRAYDTTQGVEVAWNQVKVANLPQSSRQRVVTEMKILQTLDHPSIIHFFSSFLNKETESVVFITEMMTSGTLKEFIQNRPVRLLIVKRWCKRILDALIYLHSHDPPIIHRDLKLDNIFINGSTGDIKIGDLGLASWQRNGAARSVLGTPEYMAPEMFEELYDEQVDIYAFGMCVLEMITKETPFMECTSTPQIYKKVIAGVVPDCFNRLVESPAKEFINECIKMRPPGERRPSAVELKKHPFLAKDPNNQDADGIDCQDLLKAGTQAVTSHPTTSLDGDDASVNFPKPPKPQSTVKEVFNGEPPPTNPSQLPNEDLPPSEVPTQPVSDSQPQHGQSELNTGAISATPPQQQVEEQGLQQEAPLSVPTPTVTPPPSLSQQQQVESTPQNDVNESAHPLERIPSSDLPATIRVTLCAGTAVEARFDGGDVWSPGKIDRINNDGTFAIRYEDQEYESSVSPDLIRLSSESGHQYNLGEVYRHQTKSAEETGEGPFDRQITIEASLLSQGGFSSATSTVRPGSAPPMPSSSIPEHGSDTPRSQSPVPVSIPPTSTIQQQQPQQEPIQKPGSPVPTSELPPRHPAVPQQTQMTRPHTAQPSGNNIPKAPSSVSSLPSTLLGRFWRMSAVKQGPSPSQPGAPDPLAIKFTLRNTQKKTKQTVDFDFDMVSDVATQVARELVETMSLSPSDADHIARVLDGFVRDYRNFQGSPEQFAAQAEQPGYPQRPLQPPQQQQPPPQQQQQQQPPPQQQQQQQPPPQQQQQQQQPPPPPPQQQQQPPPQQPQQQQQQQQQTTSAGQQASQSQSGGQGVDFYESLMKQVHQNFEEQKLKHQRDLESIAKMKEQHLRRMNAGTQQPSQQHQRSGGVASGVKPTIDGNASVGASSVGSVSDTEQVDLFDDSEEAKQRRRELAEKKMREEKEMIRLRKMKEAEEAEKKLFAMENLSLKDSDSTSSKKVSLKEQMQKRMMHEYSSMTSNSSSARSVSSTASTPISGSHQQPPQQQPQVTPQTSKTQPTQAVGSSQVAQQPFVHGQSSPNLVMHTQHARPMSQILQSSPSMHAANAEASTSSNHVATSSSANSGISTTSTTTPSHSSSSTSTPPTTSQNGQS